MTRNVWKKCVSVMSLVLWNTMFAGCTMSPSPPSSPQEVTMPRLPAPPPPRPSYPLISLEFVGLDADKVGSGFMATPNGEPDGHFRLLVDTGPEEFRVAGIELYTSDERGRPIFATHPGQTWSTTGSGWFLGVEREGQRLNPSDRSVRDTVRGQVIYDLFADGKTWFISNQYFTGVVKFTDGTRRSLVVRVP